MKIVSDGWVPPTFDGVDAAQPELAPFLALFPEFDLMAREILALETGLQAFLDGSTEGVVTISGVSFETWMATFFAEDEARLEGIRSLEFSDDCLPTS